MAGTLFYLNFKVSWEYEEERLIPPSPALPQNDSALFFRLTALHSWSSTLYFILLGNFYASYFIL